MKKSYTQEMTWDDIKDLVNSHEHESFVHAWSQPEVREQYMFFLQYGIDAKNTPVLQTVLNDEPRARELLNEFFKTFCFNSPVEPNHASCLESFNYLLKTPRVMEHLALNERYDWGDEDHTFLSHACSMRETQKIQWLLEDSRVDISDDKAFLRLVKSMAHMRQSKGVPEALWEVFNTFLYDRNIQPMPTTRASIQNDYSVECPGFYEDIISSLRKRDLFVLLNESLVASPCESSSRPKL